MIWPWRRFQADAVALSDEREARQNHLLIAAKDAEIASIHLRTAERDLERLANEHNTLRADFQALVGQVAGKVPPKSGSFDFGRDPFTEDPKIPTEWLTDDSELPDIASEDLLDRGQSEDGEQRGSGARQGAEGSSK